VVEAESFSFDAPPTLLLLELECGETTPFLNPVLQVSRQLAWLLEVFNRKSISRWVPERLKRGLGAELSLLRLPLDELQAKAGCEFFSGYYKSRFRKRESRQCKDLCRLSRSPLPLLRRRALPENRRSIPADTAQAPSTRARFRCSIIRLPNPREWVQLRPIRLLRRSSSRWEGVPETQRLVSGSGDAVASSTN
jgi:hypothetical protein